MKLFMRLFSVLVGETADKREGKGDVYLPGFLLGFGIFLILGGLVLVVLAFIELLATAPIINIEGISESLKIAIFSIGGLLCIILGIAAFLCWRNQRVFMLSDEEFEYTTFLGKRTVYRFSDIRGIRKNGDSMTLFVGDGKVHIESMAVISERFSARVNQVLLLLGR